MANRAVLRGVLEFIMPASRTAVQQLVPRVNGCYVVYSPHSPREDAVTYIGKGVVTDRLQRHLNKPEETFTNKRVRVYVTRRPTKANPDPASKLEKATLGAHYTAFQKLPVGNRSLPNMDPDLCLYYAKKYGFYDDFLGPGDRPTPQRQGKVIMAASPKGGVGKSTILFQLGVGLLRLGMRVLFIDLDPQGSLIRKLTSWVSEPLTEFDADIRDALLARKPLCTTIQTGTHVFDLETQLSNPFFYIKPSRGSDHAVVRTHTSFESDLADLAKDYDAVLVDTRAGMGHDAQLVSSVATHVLVPVTPCKECEYITAEYLTDTPLKESDAEVIVFGNVMSQGTWRKRVRKIKKSLILAGCTVLPTSIPSSRLLADNPIVALKAAAITNGFPANELRRILPELDIYWPGLTDKVRRQNR